MQVVMQIVEFHVKIFFLSIGEEFKWVSDGEMRDVWSFDGKILGRFVKVHAKIPIILPGRKVCLIFS